MQKREFIKTISVLGTISTIFGMGKLTAAQNTQTPQYTSLNSGQVNGVFTQAPLPYAYDALEPYIDKLTMEIHYSRHHKGYVDNLNKALTGKNATTATLEDILHSTQKKKLPAIRNNAGGHWNHTFFWESLTSNPAPMSSKLEAAINKTFTNKETFLAALTTAALSRFGSGWAWVCVNKNGDLYITSTPNQDNPLMHKVVEKPGNPLLGIDVWEHAYYLKYQNKRADYAKAIFNLINWAKVEERMV